MSGPVRIGPASIPSLPRHVKLRFDEVRKHWVVMAPERVFVPDEIAAEILRCCDGTANVDGIVDRLAAKYGAGRDEVARDVMEMLQDLANKGVVAA